MVNGTAVTVGVGDGVGDGVTVGEDVGDGVVVGEGVCVGIEVCVAGTAVATITTGADEESAHPISNNKNMAKTNACRFNKKIITAKIVLTF